MALSFHRFVGRVAVGALAVAVPVVLTPVAASAATPTDLLFSEYVEGSSNNKALEVYNGTGSSVDLVAGGYSIQMFFNGSTSAGLTINLTGALATGDVHVVANSAANALILAQADQTNGSGWFNGDDAIVLLKGATVIDSIGQIGVDPGTQWGSDLASTADNTLRRKATIVAGDTNPSDVFVPSAEWDGFPNDAVDFLGAHPGQPVDDAPAVASVNPGDGTTSTASVSPTVTFTEAVTTSASAFSLTCSVSGSVAFAFSGSGTQYTLDPTTNLVDDDECTLTITDTGVSDVDTNDPPDTLAAAYSSSFTVADICTATATPVYDIQGSGPAAAITGPVTTRGVVVADYEGPSPALRGFYVQDPDGDGDASTSDGIFVFNGSNNSVSLGDVVVVSGVAAEFQDQTQISEATVATCGTGTVTPTHVTLPMADADAFEKYEGMSVTMPQTLYVTEHFQLGRFGQVTVSSGGRLQQPTNVVAPGAEAIALQARNDLNQLIIDDTLNGQNPDPITWGRGGQPLSASNTLRGGDTTTGATGVMTYTWAGNSASGNAYRLRPVDQSGEGISFAAVNPRPTSAPDVGGAVQVAGMNLLNYFNTISGCFGGVSGNPTDCRGAGSARELERQTAKTVAAIAKIDADVIGINEIENDGYGPDSAIDDLVDAVNAAVGEGTYAFVDADAGTGQVDALGDDAIKVGFLYKPAAVTPVGQTAVLNSDEFVNGGDSAPRNRPSLAQAWQSSATGGVFVTAVNHLKSKGSECDAPDTGDGQANCAGVRTRAAKLLLGWLASDPTRTHDSDVLLVGDYNSYAKETPIVTLEAGGFTNLVEKYQGADAYSYAFDGQWGSLDQALGSLSMTTQVTGVADYHIDADEPSVLDYNTDFKSAAQIESLYVPDEYRVSDHDPVLIGLTPAPSIYRTPALEGALDKDGRSVKVGSTLPVEVTYATEDGSTPTDVAPVVQVRLDGEVVVLTAGMSYVDGYWQYLLRTADLPDPDATYRVTVLAPANGQSATGTFRLRP